MKIKLIDHSSVVGTHAHRENWIIIALGNAFVVYSAISHRPNHSWLINTTLQRLQFQSFHSRKCRRSYRRQATCHLIPVREEFIKVCKGFVYFDPLRVRFVRQHKVLFTFSILSHHRDDTLQWNPFSWKTTAHLPYIANTMVADDLAPCVVRASIAIELT